MPSETIDYKDVLAFLEAQKHAIETAISGVKQMLWLTSGEQSTAGPLVTGERREQSTEIKFDSFFRMSMPAAIVKFLDMAKAPQSVSEVTKALLDGGFKTTSKNFMPIVGSNLSRLKSAGELVNVEGKWGRASWYPAARKADQMASPKEARKRGRPKAKTEAPRTQTAQEQPPSRLTEEQIQQIKRLDAAGKPLNEIAKELGVHHLKIVNSKGWRILHPPKAKQTAAAEA